VESVWVAQLSGRYQETILIPRVQRLIPMRTMDLDASVVNELKLPPFSRAELGVLANTFMLFGSFEK